MKEFLGVLGIIVTAIAVLVGGVMYQSRSIEEVRSRDYNRCLDLQREIALRDSRAYLSCVR